MGSGSLLKWLMINMSTDIHARLVASVWVCGLLVSYRFTSTHRAREAAGTGVGATFARSATTSLVSWLFDTFS